LSFLNTFSNELTHINIHILKHTLIYMHRWALKAATRQTAAAQQAHALSSSNNSSNNSSNSSSSSSKDVG
jgi:hypothetical protein